MKQIKKIHFMGIGGSGMVAAALLAAKNGYEVTGCDQQESTAYSKALTGLVDKLYIGHREEHVKDADLLVVTPAIYYSNKDNPEIVEAKKKIPVMTWEEFLGKYLTKNKEVLAVAGTHGKSTTTTLLSLVFENARLDPSCLIGAKVKEWNANSRYGKSDLFIIEADEFNDNFLSYTPSSIILNNIEMDHPDFFKSEEQYFESFKKFIGGIKGKKILVVNLDSDGNRKLLGKLDKQKLDIYGYTFREIASSEVAMTGVQAKKVTKISILNKDSDGTSFQLESEVIHLHDIYHVNISGEHNVANTTGVIMLSKLYGISDNVVQQVLSDFDGIGRRLELIGETNGIKVYDDYAHHPTAIAATISAIKQKHPKSRIWTVVEAHSFSRTKTLLPNYKGVFNNAYFVLVGPIFKARDLEDFGISGQDIVNVACHKKAVYLDSVEKIVDKLKFEVKSGDVILVMGAGESYKWAREILNSIR
jgi:UDP-N-acetylmuramate--alanine ligase